MCLSEVRQLYSQWEHNAERPEREDLKDNGAEGKN